MSELRLAYPACVLAGETRLTAADVAELRDRIFPEGITNSTDATALFAINATVADKCPEWRAYFLNSLVTFVVQYSYPQGAMDELNADWLASMIAAGGVIRTSLEFDLLMQVIEVSTFVPDRLIVLAIDQIRAAVGEGTGAWAQRRSASRPTVVAEDMALIHQLLSRRTGHKRRIMTMPVVAVLKRIDALCRNNAVPPAWRELMAAVEVLEAAGRSTDQHVQASVAA